MLLEKTLTQQTIDMRLADKADKLEQLFLSEEEIAALERLSMPGMLESETTQRWFANCGCRGCRGCGGCGCRGCRGCRGCGGCGGCRGCFFGSNETISDVMPDTDDLGFGY